MAELRYWIAGLAACCLTSCHTTRQMEQTIKDERLSLHYDYSPDEWGFRYLPVVVQDSVRGGRMIISRDWFSGHHVLHIDGERVGLEWNAHLVGERNGKARVDYRIRVPRPLVGRRWTLRITPVAEIDSHPTSLDTWVVTGSDFSEKSTLHSRTDIPGIHARREMSRGELSLTYRCSHTIDLPAFRRLLRVYLSADIIDRVGDAHPLQAKDTLTFRIVSLADYCDMRDRYITRETDSVFEQLVTTRLSFRQGSSALDKTNPENQTNIRKLAEETEELLKRQGQVLEQITLKAACSPEGPRTLNDRLGEARGNTVRKLLILKKMLPKQTIQVSSVSENWDKLYEAITTLQPDEGRPIVERLQAIEDWDIRETILREAYPDLYARLYAEVYPQLREVQFRCRFRSVEGKRQIVTDEIDQNYMQALRWMKEWEYQKALDILLPYCDLNTAICHLCLNQNETAASLLEQLPDDAETLYLLAIAYQRMGRTRKAASVLHRSFAMDSRMKLRIAHDPEIRELISTFNRNAFTLRR